MAASAGGNTCQRGDCLGDCNQLCNSKGNLAAHVVLAVAPGDKPERLHRAEPERGRDDAEVTQNSASRG